jgi:hypothetical protein
MQSVIVIVRVPKLEIGDVFGSDGAAAVDEVFGDFSHFGDVEMCGNQFSVWQLKSNGV